MAPPLQSGSFRHVVAWIHLWIGLVLAVYLFVLSLTGSLVVLRPEFHRWLTQPQIEVGVRLVGEPLEGALDRAYPGFVVESIRAPRRADRPSRVVLVSYDGKRTERLFDPYRGVDLGSAYPPILKAVEWLVDLHDNLLGGRAGRMVNGVGGVLLTALVVTGVFVWWSGRGRWRNVIATGRPAMSSVFARRLHVALGFWVSALVFVWAVTAIYFGFPGVFDGLFELLDGDPDDDVRPGEQLLDALIKLHFGRMGGMVGRTAWIVLGLLPAVLVVTGVIAWWSRRGRSPARTGG
jgi:uncharacterized iron-regulated membrane protein